MITETHMTTQLQTFRYRRVYPSVKRVLDLMICLAILPFILVATAIIAVAIYIDSPGHIFFSQERVGLGGRRFKIFKFRTLQPDHDQLSSRDFMIAFINGEIGQDTDGETKIFKPVHTKDVTAVGRFLRKTSLDELPQIINVFRGDMSLVGPRPNVSWEVDAYKDWHKQRLAVLPGITGLAQVKGRSCLPFDTIVNYDIEYVNRQSLRLDLQILWLTAMSVVSGRGAG